MKILVTSLPDLKKITPQRYHHLLKYLSKKHDVTVLCVNAWWLEEKEDEYLKEAHNGIRFFYVSERKINPVLQELSVLWNSGNFHNRINLKEFDVHINFNSLLAGYSMTKQLKALGIPTIFDICDDLLSWIQVSPHIPSLIKPMGTAVGSFLLGRNIKHCAGITYSSDDLKQKFALPKYKSFFIPNGVDIDMFNNQETRNNSNFYNNDFILGFVGYLGDWVNFTYVFEVIRELKDQIPLKLIIVGNGSKFKELEDSVKAFGIEENVIFVGEVPYLEVPRYISIMDVCLLAFDTSAIAQGALPLKIFEYLACEKPVISTPLAGVKAAVGERVLFAPTAEQFKERILELYHDEKLRVKMGQAGREFVERNYSWEKICSEFEKVLTGAVGDRDSL